MTQRVLRRCRCGCGELVGVRQLYVDRTHYPSWQSKYMGEGKSGCYCECGCRRLAKQYQNGRYAKYAEPDCAIRVSRRRAYERIKLLPAPSGEAPLCACGCGLQVESYCGKWNKYIKWHYHTPLELLRERCVGRDFREKQRAGIRRAWLEHREAWSRKIREGQSRRSDARQQHECRCGCGQLTKRIFVNKKHESAYKLNNRGEPPLCACGCGGRVKWGDGWNKYIKGHHSNDPNHFEYTRKPEYMEKMRQVMNTPEKLAELSEKSRQNYFKAGYIEKWSKAVNMRPNNFEFLFDCLTSKDIKYVGNAKLWIRLPDGKPKNPDFIFGKDKVIELHGDYWHRGEDASELIQAYKEVGYDCLVIWEKEMQDINLVLQKVAEFIGQETWQLSLPLR